MPINTMSPFNREIQNCLVIAVRQNDGKVHGNMWKIADLIASEMFGPAYPADISRMKTHLLAVGLEYIAEGSSVVIFQDAEDYFSIVERESVK